MIILIAQVMHAATFGAYHAASVGLVHEFFRGRHQSKGQALFGSVTYGASVLYSCSAGMALVGMLLMWWALRNVAEGRAAVA